MAEVSASEYIRIHSGIGAERLREVVKNNREYWDFTVADRILCAIDRQDALVNGEIEVIEDDVPITIKSDSLCQCGCGERTLMYRKTRLAIGAIKGQPRRYLTGHGNRGKKGTYTSD